MPVIRVYNDSIIAYVTIGDLNMVARDYGIIRKNSSLSDNELKYIIPLFKKFFAEDQDNMAEAIREGIIENNKEK